MPPRIPPDQMQETRRRYFASFSLGSPSTLYNWEGGGTVEKQPKKSIESRRKKHENDSKHAQCLLDTNHPGTQAAFFVVDHRIRVE